MLIDPISSRATIPLGDCFLRFDPSDPGYHWSLWKRHPERLDTDLLVVNWSGQIPKDSDDTTVNGIQFERDGNERGRDFLTFDMDQDFAAGLEMAARHGRDGDEWFAMIERALGHTPAFDKDAQEALDPEHRKRWSVR